MNTEFKAGLEIHQQLDTKKLFCSCETKLSEDVKGEFKRMLRPVQSELGEIDLASIKEWQKNRIYNYQITDNSCLVEMDEEPPHDVNEEALKISIMVSLMLNCKLVDEIHFMRKIVIDGSDTSGFQRTALIGLNGYIDTEFGRISIKSVCLEEEAARKINETEETVTYRLDRLGIPLIEIATGPDMNDPNQVKIVAEKIGYFLRATKKVKRGLGTIRQDINISTGGNRVEIKGVSKLNLIDKIVKYEIDRQKMLFDIAEELKNRNVKLNDFNIRDLTDIFENSNSKIIRNNLSKGWRVYGMKLNGFKGLLKGGNFRLGKELADIAKVNGLSGLFHSDELPNYGISKNEVEYVNERLGIGENDAFILIVSPPQKAENIMLNIYERAKNAFYGVIPETRRPKDDGTTEYLRPLPGRERIYPETDIPPIRIDEKYIEEIKKILPPTYEEMVNIIMKKYNISMQQAKQIINEEMEDIFEYLYSIYPDGNLIFRIYFNIIPELSSKGLDVNKITNDIIEDILKNIRDGKIVKDSIQYILSDFINNNKLDYDKYKPMSDEEIKNLILNIIDNNKDLMNKQNRFQIIMGLVMKSSNGRAEGSRVSEIIKKIMEENNDEIRS
ncbi:MAG: Glu-tRNA(Gln) amidotransferase subunit GatE [Thermoplasmata archaeon]|jgi:glutamyl-tRNA(Gln) amidotransferase subunit E